MPGYYDYYDEFTDLIENQEKIINQNNTIIENQNKIISGDNIYHQDQIEYNIGFTYGLVIISCWCTLKFLILCGNLLTTLIRQGGIFHA